MLSFSELSSFTNIGVDVVGVIFFYWYFVDIFGVFLFTDIIDILELSSFIDIVFIVAVIFFY